MFIGIQLDSRLMRAAPSQHRVDEIIQLLQQFRRDHTCAFRYFQAPLGMFTAASSVVPLGLLTLRPFQIWMNNLGLHPQHHGHKQVIASCVRCLHPWRRQSRLIQGVPMGSILSHSVAITTNSSLTGCCTVWQCWAVRASWTLQ